MTKIAILHTANATVAQLNKLIHDQFNDVEIMNWLDDTILPALIKQAEKYDYPFEKLLQYAQFAERQGADYIINACSSVGPFKDYAKQRLMTPIIRIDDPVTDILANKYESIAVIGTIPTTLKPSTDLLKKKNAHLNVNPILIEGAFELGRKGYKDEHDKAVIEAVVEALEDNEAVFLAQASMAEALSLLDSSLQERVYSSPEYLMNYLHTILD